MQRVFFLVRSWKSFGFFDRCVDSIFAQKNTHYTILYIDDASGLSPGQKRHIRLKLRDHIVQFNTRRKYAVQNAYEAIHRYVPDEAIVINLDGDDWLIRDDVVDIIIRAYKKNAITLTYGNCLYYKPGGPLDGRVVTDIHPFANTRYPQGADYRSDYFRPHHLRSWKASAFKAIAKREFLFADGSWLRFCEDEAIMFPLLEASKENYVVISTTLSVYNLSGDMQDDRIYRWEKIADEVYIRRKRSLPIVQSFTHEKTVEIRYSQFLRIPLVGQIYYIFEIIGALLGAPKQVFVGNRDRILERLLCSVINRYKKIALVVDSRVGHSARFFETCVCHITTQPKDGSEVAESLMWVLTHVAKITPQSAKWLTKKYPTMKKILGT